MISIVLMLVLNGQSLALRQEGDVDLVAQAIQTAAVSIGQSDQDDDVDLITSDIQTASVSVDRSPQDNDGMDLVAQDVQTTTLVGVGQSHTLSHGDDAYIQAAEAKKSPWILTYPNYFVSLEVSCMWYIAMYVCMYVCVRGGVF